MKLIISLSLLAGFALGCLARLPVEAQPEPKAEETPALKRMRLPGDKLEKMSDGHDLWVFMIGDRNVGIMHALDCRKCKPKFD